MGLDIIHLSLLITQAFEGIAALKCFRGMKKNKETNTNERFKRVLINICSATNTSLIEITAISSV